MQYLTCYFLFVNAISFGLMYQDKQRAKQQRWRIPEAQLLFFCLAGGFFGTYLMMKYGRHKSLHWQFHAAVIMAFLFWLFVLPATSYYLLCL